MAPYIEAVYESDLHVSCDDRCISYFQYRIALKPHPPQSITSHLQSACPLTDAINFVLKIIKVI